MINLKILSFLIFSLCLFRTSVQAQKFLRVDKTGKAYTLKYYEGQKVTFKLFGEDEKYETERIKMIDAEQGIIHFNYYFIKIEDIEVIKRSRIGVKSMATSLMTFGTTWGVYSILTVPVGNELGTNSWAVPAVSIGSGLALWKLFGDKKMRKGKKYNFLLIDTTF